MVLGELQRKQELTSVPDSDIFMSPVARLFMVRPDPVKILALPFWRPVPGHA